MWTTHPRTKNSEGYPEAYKDQPFFQSDRFIGASWESLPVDLSEKEECEVRCFGTQDDMSNWAPKAKFMIAEGDTYTKWPDDETYPQLAINYVKLDKVPLYNESWAPIIDLMRRGDFYGTTGEVLFHNWGVQGSGAKSVYTANIEYTYPARIRGPGMERWHQGRAQVHRPYRHRSLRNQGVQDSLRRHRQEVDSVLRVGFGRKRCLGSAN
jgi:hypothetical protein